MIEFPILTSMIFTPILGAIFILLFCGSNTHLQKKIIKSIALLFSLVTLVLSLCVYVQFDTSSLELFQFQEKHMWFKNYNIAYYVGVDPVSIYMIMLTTFLMVVCVICSWNTVLIKIKEYFIAFLVLESLIIGTFSALDFVLFYLFFESVLIPMFIIIGIWGSEDRVAAAYKFFLYTLFGSVFLLVGIIYIYQSLSTTNILEITEMAPKLFSIDVQKWLWIAFFLSFAIKIPMWPFHTWLPDAHVQAPTAGSVILAGVLLKMGGYGFIRFSLPMLPEASVYFSDFVYVLSIIAIVYASLLAFAQTNIKKLIAYSSVAHMGFVTLGIFSFNTQGIYGAIVQMISHGLVSGALFLSVGVLYDRTCTKNISDYGGVAQKMPVFAVILMIITLSSVAVPGTSGFVGEFLVLLGSYQVNRLYSFLAASGMLLGAIYMLWLYARVMLGNVQTGLVKALRDLSLREMSMFIPILVFIIFIGIYPSFLMDFVSKSVDALVYNFSLYVAIPRGA